MRLETSILHYEAGVHCLKKGHLNILVRNKVHLWDKPAPRPCLETGTGLVGVEVDVLLGSPLFRLRSSDPLDLRESKEN